MTDFKEGLGALLSEQNLEVTEVTEPITIDNEPTENITTEHNRVANDAQTTQVDGKNGETTGNEPIKQEAGQDGGEGAGERTEQPTGGDSGEINNRERQESGSEGQKEVVGQTRETVQETEITNTDPVEPKTFNELIAERTQGKYKNYEEIETALTPKEVFANDQLKNINELIKNGATNMDEVLAYYGKDFSSMTDAESILKTEMKMSGKYEGWSDSELTLLIDDKYKRNEWTEEGEDTNSTEKLQSKLLLRDSAEAKQKLIDKQDQLTIVKEPTQDEQNAWKAEVEKGQNDWNSYVDSELGSKVTKLSTVIDEKSNEVFDYVYSDAERQGASEMMKSLNADMKFFWNQFNNAEGKLDYKKVYEMLLWNGSKDKMLKVAVRNARAEGAEKEVRDSKNITLGTKKNDGTPQQVPEKTLATSLIQSKGY
jgi:hypothetical protein